MLQINIESFKYLEKIVLHNISFRLQKGHHLSIIGESGCGKSTLLKLIYGLYDCDNGNLSWNEHQILGPRYHLVPGMSFAKYLAQDFDLMPFVTVGENVGKYLSNFYPKEKQERIDALLTLVEMHDYKHTKAKFLSGGQMQRVAIARALAQEPEILLLDEPFSHIDNFQKNKLRRNLFEFAKQNAITVITATHEVQDVLPYANEIIVLKEGKIIAQNTPESLYFQPSNLYIAKLFDEASEIIIDNIKKIVYPNQIKIVPQSALVCSITKSYFYGACYKNFALLQEQEICFYSENAFQIGDLVGIEV